MEKISNDFVEAVHVHQDISIDMTYSGLTRAINCEIIALTYLVNCVKENEAREL